METMNHTQLENLAVRAYKTGFALFVYGGFGIGKSQTERKIARKLSDGREYVEWNRIPYNKKEEVIENADRYFVNKDLRLAQLDPSDINGIPDIGGDRKYLKWNPPSWAVWSAQPEAKGFLFFDEANLASPAVMKAFYQVVHDREIGDISISDGVGIMSAGNRQEDNAGIKPMPKPLQDRYFEVELRVPTMDEWEDWAIENQIDPHIISFLNMKPDYLYMPRKRDSKIKPASPRGWEQISKMLGRIENNLDSSYFNFIRTTVSSRVGEDAGREFVEFIRNSRKIDIRDYINNPEGQSIPEKSDLKWTLVSGIVNWYRGLEDDDKKDKGLEVSMKVANMFKHADFTLNLLHQVKVTDEAIWDDHITDTSVWRNSKFTDEVLDLLTGDF